MPKATEFLSKFSMEELLTEIEERLSYFEDRIADLDLERIKLSAIEQLEDENILSDVIPYIITEMYGMAGYSIDEDFDEDDLEVFEDEEDESYAQYMYDSYYYRGIR